MTNYRPLVTVNIMCYEIHTTEIFNKWLKNIKDKITHFRIDARLTRLTEGNFGDAKSVSNNLFELRFTFGGGIRIYYTIQGERIILLLHGGNKSTQSKDIEKAKKIIEELS